MIPKVIIAITFFAIASSIPVDHPKGPYVTLGLSGYSTTKQQNHQQVFISQPQYHSTPTYLKKQTPILVKVPTHISTPAYALHNEEKYGPAQYEFKYSVEDIHTGDIKSQHEVRNGDKVQGEYSLHEADGTIRTVKYTADKQSGFNAVVEKSGHASHPEIVPVKAVSSVPITYDFYKH